MKTIVLPAYPSHDLDWNLDLDADELLFEFDFGWNRGPFLINDPALFQSYTLALDQFSNDVWPAVQNRCCGVVLYRGSLSILSYIVSSEGELTALETATIFGNYLHRLASFLPDEVMPYALFEDHAGYTAGEAAQLLSQERYAHLSLSLQPTEEPAGVLLPPDELCTPELLEKLTQLLISQPHLRVIPERRLNELWNGLDELIIFEQALTLQGKRQLLGFEAAGGKIRSRGI